jgi:hypothetical protein
MNFNAVPVITGAAFLIDYLINNDLLYLHS